MRVLVESLLADHHQAAAARRVRRPFAVELVLDAGAHALHQQPHRLARRSSTKPFMRSTSCASAAFTMRSTKRLRRGEDRQVDDEGVEIVVIVLVLEVVVRRAVGEIGFGLGAQAQQDGDRHPAVLRLPRP